ncbi:MAG TPA: hypothetical protein VN648_33120 [Candidatus Methylomirabilis sp.]|nr:hypothetical protein [Candidatus Methylomirabilis sp.]
MLSAFRMAPGGAQEYYGVTPDVCTLAKAVANGLPLAVVAGRALRHLFRSPFFRAGCHSLAGGDPAGGLLRPNFHQREAPLR